MRDFVCCEGTVLRQVTKSQLRHCESAWMAGFVRNVPEGRGRLLIQLGPDLFAEFIRKEIVFSPTAPSQDSALSRDATSGLRGK